MTSERPRGLANKKIGIFGKGGAGKSTVSVLLARSLRDTGYEVVLLDADSTNVGLSAALGVDRLPQTLIDYFGGMVFSGGSVSCPVDDPTPLSDADLHLDQMPEGLAVQSPEGIWLLEAGKIGHRGPGAGCDGPIAKISRDVRIHGKGENLVTVVDFKAGFEDSARGVVTGLDWVIVVVDPTCAAIQMAVDTKTMVRQIAAGALPATRHLESDALVDLAQSLYWRSRINGVLCVLNKITDEQTERFLRARLNEKGIEPIGVIHDHRSVTTSWLRGQAIDTSEAREEAREVVERLEAAEAENIRPAKVRVAAAAASGANR